MRDRGATMESTKEIISQGASSAASAIWYTGESSLSVTAMTPAPRSRANFTVFMVTLEYRGKLMAMRTSSAPMRNSCSKISPAALDCTRGTFSIS